MKKFLPIKNGIDNSKGQGFMKIKNLISCVPPFLRIPNKKRLQKHRIFKFIFIIIANKESTANSITLVPSLILGSDLLTSAK